MSAAEPRNSNFAFLEPYEPLARLGFLAERLYAEDPCSTLVKLRHFGEVLAQKVAARYGAWTSPQENQASLLARLRGMGLNQDVLGLLHELRRAGNAAAHEMVGDGRTALQQIRMARALGQWYVRLVADRNFQAPPFVPPPDPRKASEALRADLRRLREELVAARAESADLQERARAEAIRRADAEALAAQRAEEAAFWQSTARQREQELTSELLQLQADLAEAQKEAEEAGVVETAPEALATTPLSLSEADTRHLIDQQLREAGWEVDSQALTWGSGARPLKGRSMAIAEWPTEKGPADYVLFVDQVPVAVVEAKRNNKNAASAIEQAKRYSRGFAIQGGLKDPGGPWGEYRVPFLFSSNGRAFLRQLPEMSGTWFLDARNPTNHPRALNGWYTPTGLKKLLAQDVEAAHQALRQEPADYLDLRYYQREAIAAVEAALEAGRREVMVAMATGTGKTRTCIGLLYRLLKAELFQRVLFLVDRTALGEQALNALQGFKLERMQAFPDIYEVKGLTDSSPGPTTRLHLATIQGMMRRLLFREEEALAIPVDQYDCIVVDECHRGYSLDRDLSEAELTFRNELDYISKYRRVLDHFDAVKVGLTATPALHTSAIFGDPVYEYGYRQAVLDGYLVDHEPPFRIVTALAEDGITWQAGESVELYRVKNQQLDLFHLEDEVTLELETFNRKVLTESFNRTVCRVLAQHIDPEDDGKTLVFCVNDTHADMVVRLLKEALDERYGGVDDDAVMKITGAADRCLEKIRHFKNEKYPNVAVTVDLLTTGIDVPEIVNLVFLRRVKSRILYEQMLGRATRLCDAIGKECFRIYDAVDLYAGMEPYSNMKPVVANPKITFRQLVDELEQVQDSPARHAIIEQFLARLQRKKGKVKGANLEQFTAIVGLTPQELARTLKEMDPDQAAAWLQGRGEMADLLDRVAGDGTVFMVSHHEDELRRVEQGYGEGQQRPADYLESFRRFIRENLNEITALQVVLQRPRDLTRQQLRELKLELDRHHFRETELESAWRETTDQEVAASVIGFIRQAALGSPLVPYAERVEKALQRILGRAGWDPQQRKWLERIAAQMKAETIVDRAALDAGEFARRGGFRRLDRLFEGRLAQVLGDLHEAAWDDRQTA